MQIAHKKEYFALPNGQKIAKPSALKLVNGAYVDASIIESIKNVSFQRDLDDKIYVVVVNRYDKIVQLHISYDQINKARNMRWTLWTKKERATVLATLIGGKAEDYVDTTNQHKETFMTSTLSSVIGDDILFILK